VGGVEIHIIPASPAELSALHAEKRSYQTFFMIFGGIFALSALIALWPYNQISRMQWSVFGVCLLFFTGFFLLYLHQLKGVRQNLSDTNSIMYSGWVTRKEELTGSEGGDYRIYIEDRPFDVAALVYHDIHTGDFLAVREWRSTGEYIEHTTDRGYAEALRKRAVA